MRCAMYLDGIVLMVNSLYIASIILSSMLHGHLNPFTPMDFPNLIILRNTFQSFIQTFLMFYQQTGQNLNAASELADVSYNTKGARQKWVDKGAVVQCTQSYQI